MHIGFIGLGRMGTAMATNLMRAGHHLTVWNRNPNKLNGFADDGASIASTPADAAQGELVVTMVADDVALDTITFGDNGILGCPALHVSMSTVSIALVDRLTAATADRFVSAPVFGRPDAAAAAQLAVIAAGPSHLLDRCAGLFEAVARRTFRVGDRPSAANIVKLCGNFSIMAMVESMAEAMSLAERNGVERAVIAEVMANTLFPGVAYQNYSKLLVENQFVPPGFPAALGLKDMDLVSSAASDSLTPMPVLSVIRDNFLSLLAHGDGQIDWAGVARVTRRAAALE